MKMIRNRIQCQPGMPRRLSLNCSRMFLLDILSVELIRMSSRPGMEGIQNYSRTSIDTILVDKMRSLKQPVWTKNLRGIDCRLIDLVTKKTNLQDKARAAIQVRYRSTL